ncbi:ATP-dependent RNA helicase HAS1 [Entamoeba marina]
MAKRSKQRLSKKLQHEKDKGFEVKELELPTDTLQQTTESITLPVIANEKTVPFTSKTYPIPSLFNSISSLINQMNITELNHVQNDVIELLLTKSDVYLNCSQENEAVTTAILHTLYLSQSYPSIADDTKEETKGPFIIFVCSDSESCQSVTTIIKSLMDINVTCLNGCVNKKKESKSAERHDPILVTTVSSLLNQLVNNSSFTCKNLQFLAIPTFDQLSTHQLTNDLIKILNRLPRRQTFINSNSEIPQSVTSIALSNATHISFTEDIKTIEQEVGCVFVKLSDRNNFISTIVQQRATSKTILHFFSKEEAIFYDDILNRLDYNNILLLHQSLPLPEQSKIIKQFKELQYGVLVTTQHYTNCSSDLAVYVDTPKTLTKVTTPSKQLLIVLQDGQTEFYETLKNQRKTKEYTFPPSKLHQAQLKINKLVEKQYYVHLEARDAYRAYIQNYSQLTDPSFNVKKLNLIEIAKSYGLPNPTKVNLDNQGPIGVSEKPYEYKRKVFIGKQVVKPNKQK